MGTYGGNMWWGVTCPIYLYPSYLDLSLSNLVTRPALSIYLKRTPSHHLASPLFAYDCLPAAVTLIDHYSYRCYCLNGCVNIAVLL